MYITFFGECSSLKKNGRILGSGTLTFFFIIIFFYIVVCVYIYMYIFTFRLKYTKFKPTKVGFCLSYYTVLYANIIQLHIIIFGYVQKAEKMALVAVNSLVERKTTRILDRIAINVSFYNSRYFDMHCILLPTLDKLEGNFSYYNKNEIHIS